jgi:hypothetical protein
MKLQKVKAYKTSRGRYQYKYLISIPEASIIELGWQEGVELNPSTEDGHLRIDLAPAKSPKQNRRVITTKMSYEEFRNKVKETLQYQDNGMTWSQIRGKLKLDQVVPNNKWVWQLQKDIGLERLKQKDNQIIWRIRHV